MRKLLKIPYRIINKTLQKLIPSYKKLRKYEQELKYWESRLEPFLKFPIRRWYPKLLNISQNHFERLPNKGKRILDVGCGPFGASEELLYCDRYGIDPLIHDYQIIGYPLWKHDIKYFNCYSEKMPFTTGFFDAVIAVNSLDHVDDFYKTTQEMIRVVKSGGEIIFQVEYHEPWNTEPQEINDQIIRDAFPIHIMMSKMEKVKTYFGDEKGYEDVEYATWHGKKL